MEESIAMSDADKTAAPEAFSRLLDIMDRLRKGCPWDREQTIESLRYLTIEETYELSDAILASDFSEIRKELGDLLLHIVFYSKIATEQSQFTITEVIEGLSEKLIRRHPHIFGTVEAATPDAVKANWEAIKLTEKGRKTVLGGVPKGLPAMVKAYRIQEKARGVGFDWDHRDQVWDKVLEEQGELQQALADNEAMNRVEEEFGDYMFALVNYARFIGVNADDALEKANTKFMRRFNYVESKTLAQGKDLHSMSLDEMNVYWEQAKLEE